MAEAFGQDAEGARWLQDKIKEARKSNLEAKPIESQTVLTQR